MGMFIAFLKCPKDSMRVVDPLNSAMDRTSSTIAFGLDSMRVQNSRGVRLENLIVDLSTRAMLQIGQAPAAPCIIESHSDPHGWQTNSDCGALEKLTASAAMRMKIVFMLNGI